MCSSLILFMLREKMSQWILKHITFTVLPHTNKIYWLNATKKIKFFFTAIYRIFFSHNKLDCSPHKIRKHAWSLDTLLLSLMGFFPFDTDDNVNIFPNELIINIILRKEKDRWCVFICNKLLSIVGAWCACVSCLHIYHHQR